VQVYDQQHMDHSWVQLRTTRWPAVHSLLDERTATIDTTFHGYIAVDTALRALQVLLPAITGNAYAEHGHERDLSLMCAYDSC